MPFPYCNSFCAFTHIVTNLKVQNNMGIGTNWKGSDDDVLAIRWVGVELGFRGGCLIQLKDKNYIF